MKQYRITRRNQGGWFIPLVIAFLLIIGTITAVLSQSGQQSSGGADKERARMHATAVINQGVMLRDAITRAQVDGIPAATIASDITTLSTNNYVSGGLPAAPIDSQATATAWAYAAGTFQVTDSQATPADLGTAAKDDVIYLDKLTAAVCQRINNVLYGESTLTAIGGSMAAAAIAGPTISTNTQFQTGSSEGCVAHGTDYAYYKVVSIK